MFNFLNRIALERAKFYHKLPESYIYMTKRSSNKRTLSFKWPLKQTPNIILKIHNPPLFKHHLAKGVAFIENISVTVTVGEIHEN